MSEFRGGLPPLSAGGAWSHSPQRAVGMSPNRSGQSPSRAGSGFGSRPSSAESNGGSGVRFSARNRTHESRRMTADPYARQSRGHRPSTVMSLPANIDSNGVRSRYTSFHSSRGHRPLGSAQCIKCMLQMPHKRCEAHKYIRVGGGYRHSYSYLKAILDELQSLDYLSKDKLAAIAESFNRSGDQVSVDSAFGGSETSSQAGMELADSMEPWEPIKPPGSPFENLTLSDDEDQTAVRAVKTYIRTKSGRLIERIVFMSEDDYHKFQAGGGADVLKKYLSKDEAENLESWDKEEVIAIKTYIRTKSGRLKEQLVYVSKSDYDKIKSGAMNEKDVMNVLKKYVKTENGEKLDGWGEAEMRTIKTMVRTKSGRLIEKTILVSKEEYDEIQRIQKAGGDINTVLGKYMSKDEKVESFKKVTEPEKPMKVIKTMVRTKSGRLIEKTIVMTEEEYRQFEASGGDKNLLRKLLGLGEDEQIESWEKASTIYGGDSDDEQMKNAKAGERIVGDDGVVYEVYIDPKTGKKYKKKLGKVDDFEDLDAVLAGGKVKYKKGRGKKGKKGGGSDDDLPSAAEIKRYKERKAGKRDPGSDSEYSYRSVRSAGGTRKVVRRRKRADGTYSAEEEYNSADDEEGKARRRRRRRERKHGEDSDHSYYSVVSAGGTRRVRRRRRKGDGTYGTDEEYHSDESIRMKRAAKKKKKQRGGSDSDYSYFSEVSAGGTRTKKRKKRIRDKDGKVIGHGAGQVYSSDSDSSYESYYDEYGNKKYRKKPPKPGKGKHKKNEYGGKKSKLGKSRKDYVGGFSDQSTDTEDEPDLEAMTEEERRDYLEKKAARRAEREKRRREKYGDKYEEIMKQHDKNKKQLRKERALAEGLDWDSDEYEKDPEAFKQKYKSMVTYEKGADRGLGKKGKMDGGGIGLGHDDWGGKGGKKTIKIKDGNEADSESEEDDGKGGRRKKKKGIQKVAPGATGDDSETESFIGADGKKKRRTKGKDGEDIIESDFEYEIEYDEHGRIKRKKKKYHDGESGSEYEFEYDALGNLIGKKKIKEGKESKKHRVKQEDDGNYFEKGPDGKIRLRPGRNQIDIDKLTADDLRALGIDPNMSKQDIARALKAKFGDSLVITKGGQKVGLRNANDYGSDADTDDLANDSDLDTSTLKPGKRRVNILMKKGGQAILEYMKKMIEDANLVENIPEPEQDNDIDYLAAYRLVDKKKIDGYARAFVVEDDNKAGVITYKDAKVALEAIPSISSVTKKQLNYIEKVLSIDEHSDFSFRMFGVMVALAERVTKMDNYCKELLEICNLADIERKIALYKSMFECNTASDRDPNYIKCEALMIELIAGGLSWQQQDYVMSQLEPNDFREVSFLDYLVYIPLFLSMHDGICDNPLDMSLNKYAPGHHVTEQRDMNPLGYSLKSQTAFLMRQQADDLLSGKKPDMEQARKENQEVLNRYSKLPDIIGKMETRPPGAPRYM